MQRAVYGLIKAVFAAQDNFHLSKEKSVPYVITTHYITTESMVCINLSLDLLALHKDAEVGDDTDLVGICFLEATHSFMTVGIEGLTKKDGESQRGVQFCQPLIFRTDQFRIKKKPPEFELIVETFGIILKRNLLVTYSIPLINLSP